MYTLRIIEETRKNKNTPFEQVITDYYLGESYSTLVNGKTSEFTERMQKSYSEYNTDDVKMIVCGENGKELFVMNDKENERGDYFIMTASGSTLRRL